MSWCYWAHNLNLAGGGHRLLSHVPGKLFRYRYGKFCTDLRNIDFEPVLGPVWLYEATMSISLVRYDVQHWFRATHFSLPVVVSKINGRKTKNSMPCANFG